MLSEKLFEKCEEFFDLVSIEHRNEEVAAIINQVTDHLTDEIDGRTNRENFVIAEEVELQIQELWDLLPIDERKTNNNLRDYYDDIMEFLSDKFDESSAESEDGDLDDFESDFSDEEE